MFTVGQVRPRRVDPALMVGLGHSVLLGVGLSTDYPVPEPVPTDEVVMPTSDVGAACMPPPTQLRSAIREVSSGQCRLPWT
jgi:hypothetical protein